MQDEITWRVAVTRYSAVALKSAESGSDLKPAGLSPCGEPPAPAVPFTVLMRCDGKIVMLDNVELDRASRANIVLRWLALCGCPNCQRNAKRFRDTGSTDPETYA